jgi:anti-sigma-K factor RskA
MFNDTYFPEIDAYVSGNMTPDERTLFENRLKTEPDLAAELVAFQDVLGGIEPLKRESLRHKIGSVTEDLAAEGFFKNEEKTTEQDPLSIKSKIADIHAEFAEKGFFESENKVKTRRLSVWQWAAAASIALLVAVGLWLVSSKKTDNSATLVAEAFQAETVVPDVLISKLKSQTGMASGEAADVDLLRCFELYKAKNYAAAKTALQAHITQFGDKTDKRAAEFYFALTCISTHTDGEKAISTLQNLQKETAWASEVNWFLALAYLQNGKNTEGVNLLKKIEEGNDNFKNEAANLRQKFEKQ